MIVQLRFHLFGPGFTADAFHVAEEMAGQPLPVTLPAVRQRAANPVDQQMEFIRPEADLLSPPDLAEVGPNDVQSPADLVQLSETQLGIL